MPVKPFNGRSSDLIEASKIIDLGRLASVASSFYKINKIKGRYINVFIFYLASLVYLTSLSD
jgi:hypothetical protein